MPIQIGARSHNFTEPLGLLSDCHRRIEMFIASLSAIAKLGGQPLNDEGRRALENALRYFREAAPKHTADEEQSLFPRLRGLNSPQCEPVIARMDDLENDHQWAEALHTEVDRLGKQYLTHGTLPETAAAEFLKGVEALAAMYQKHIALEDEAVFPLAVNVLSPGDKLAIAQEMADRRRKD